MSLLRRSLMSSLSNEIYYTKFTLKFVEGSNNNILYVNTNKYYGIGFLTRIGGLPTTGYNKIATAIQEKVIITENQSGEIIYSYDYIHPKYATNENVEHVVYNTTTNTKLRTGLYTVEIYFKASGKLTLTEDANTMISRKDIVFINDYTSKNGTDKNATTFTLKCLYNIEVEKPDGEDASFEPLTSGRKGVVNNMTHFVEGE